MNIEFSDKQFSKWKCCQNIQILRKNVIRKRFEKSKKKRAKNILNSFTEFGCKLNSFQDLDNNGEALSGHFEACGD